MCDISLSYLKQIENINEYKNVTLTVMLTLAKALDTNVSSLFKEENKEFKDDKKIQPVEPL